MACKSILQASGHFRAAVNLTTKLLSDLGQGPGMSGQPSKNTFLTFEVTFFPKIAKFFRVVLVRFNYVFLQPETLHTACRGKWCNECKKFENGGA